MDWLLFLAVIGAGFAAGFINTLAGSGSALTLPLLVFMGLPATVANGTNRIGVLLQTAVSTWTFHEKGKMPWREAVFLLIPSVLGGVAGAAIAVDLDEQRMRQAIGAMLILTFFLILFDPTRWLKGRVGGARQPGGKEWILFFFVGLYGGFIQAGVGIFMLVGLVLVLGNNLMHANAVKSLLVLALNIAAFVVFVRNGQVDWLLGFVLAIGNIAGARVAALMATKEWAQVWVYRLLLVVVVYSAVQMFLD